MVCDIYRAQNRLVFCALVVGGFVIVQNCKFFAEIWVQGDFCEFWNLHPSLVKPADFWAVCDVCCVVQNVFIDENFVNKDFYKFYNFFDFNDC